MDKYRDVLASLTSRTGVAFRPATPADLSALRQLGFPKSIVDFYAEHEPSRLIELKIRLWPITHIIEENTQAMPGMFSAPVGFVVFATTLFGNCYCFDLTATDGGEDPPVVLISHEIINQEVRAEDVAEIAKPIAGSLLNFLELMTAGTVDEEPIE